MDADKLMVRSHDDGVNLAIGEPFFLRKPLSWLIPLPWPVSGSRNYPHYAGEKQLLQALERRHPGYKVVVANGGKQALLAGLYALKQKYPYIDDSLFHAAPHWPSYPTLAQLSGLEFRTTDDVGTPTFTAAAVPNNPDSRVCAAVEKYDIWDAAYAHPVYGWDGVEPQHRLSCWSAAKLLGLSGLRVGWLLTKDEDLWAAAADYVEKTTSGVCTNAQANLAAILSKMEDSPNRTRISYELARQDLLKNSDIFNNYLGNCCEWVEGLPSTGVGMFAWYKVFDPQAFEAALHQLKILVVPGRACGEDEPGLYRMSLGQTPEFLEHHLKALAEAL